MELKGSCHCEKVSFKVLSHTPAPFMWCYCSICRKCQGGGGYAINIMGQYDTLEILTGKEYLKQYQAMKNKEKKELGGNIRFFCGECGTHLYAYDKEWAQWCYPFASCIDTPLPKMDAATDCYHIMQNSKPDWVPVPKDAKHIFEEYPDCSLEDWHKQHKQFIE